MFRANSAIPKAFYLTLPCELRGKFFMQNRYSKSGDRCQNIAAGIWRGLPMLARK